MENEKEAYGAMLDFVSGLHSVPLPRSGDDIVQGNPWASRHISRLASANTTDSLCFR
jgi:hypothetical protein